MRTLLLALALCAAATSGTAAPRSDTNAATQVVVAPLPDGSVARPVALARLRTQLRPDQQVGVYRAGVVCVSPYALLWKQIEPQFVNFDQIFGEELKAAGFKPESDPGNLFADQEHVATDLQVGGMIKGLDASYCGDLLHVSGKIRIDVEWQVYSTLRREVIATISTHEMAEKSRGMGGKDEGRSLAQLAFAANVRGLLANEAFRKIVVAPDPVMPSAEAIAATQAPIVLAGQTKGTVRIADAVGSVVSVFSGDAFGSGVLVSSDGYVLTNHHVVAGAKVVRIRWSDGLETPGEVVRSDKRRDVALIKTAPRGRTALAVNRAIPAAGTPVYAIGTPLDPKLQSTVTRGVVSASRIVNGFSFIQGDVPVTHGNSGGPLLDERGAVVGLTDWGVPAEAGSVLNFFIPIGDALDFLSLKVSG